MPLPPTLLDFFNTWRTWLVAGRTSPSYYCGPTTYIIRQQQVAAAAAAAAAAALSVHFWSTD